MIYYFDAKPQVNIKMYPDSMLILLFDEIMSLLYYSGEGILKVSGTPIEILRSKCGCFGNKSLFTEPDHKWVSENFMNMSWMVIFCDLAFAEYTYRFKKVHVSFPKFILYIKNNLMPYIKEHYDSSISLTEFPIDNIDESLRLRTSLTTCDKFKLHFLNRSLHIISEWTNRDKPDWVK